MTPASAVKTTASTTVRKRNGDQNRTDLRSCRFIKSALGGARRVACGLYIIKARGGAQNESDGRLRRTPASITPRPPTRFAARGPALGTGLPGRLTLGAGRP